MENNETLLDVLKRIIETSIPDSTAYVLDPMCDETHLQAIVISPVFADMMLVKQHKMVMSSLKDAFAGPVHSLGLKTFTPEKWEQEKSQYDIN